MDHPGFPFKRSIASATRESRESDDFIDLERLLAMVVRQARVLIVCALVGLALGVLAALAVVAAALYFTFKHGEISTLAFLGFGPPLLVMAGHLAWLRWARAAPVPSAPG